MNKNKAGIIVTCIVAAMIAALAITLMITQREYVKVTAIEYNAVLDQHDDKGVVTVTEQITFDVHASSNTPDGQFWELWRGLPEEWIDGVNTVYFEVISVARISVNGNSEYTLFDEASRLFWDDYDYVSNAPGLGKEKWYHSKGPYNDYNQFECIMIYPGGLYREKIVFELVYKIHGAVVNYLDYSELYMPMYGEEGTSKEISNLNSFKGSITIPNSKMPTDYHAWSYGTNQHEFEFNKTQDASNTIFKFDLSKEQLKFSRYNGYLEFSLIAYGQDKSKLASNARRDNTGNYALMMEAQQKYLNLPAQFKDIKLKTLYVCLALALLVILIVLLTHKIKSKKYPKPTLKYDFYREIPDDLDANFAGSFAFCKHKMSYEAPGGYASAMLGLVRKNYIQIDRINPNKEWSLKNSVIKTLDNADRELTLTESAYLRLINRYKKEGKLTLTDLQKRITMDFEYSHTFNNDIVNMVKGIGVAKGYYKSTEIKKPKYNAILSSVSLAIIGVGIGLISLITRLTRLDLAFGAFLVLGASFVISAIMLGIFAKGYVLLTQQGEDEYSKWRGLYNFLNSETLIKERVIEEIAIWEDYLLYATAFGISEKVVKALKVNFPEFSTVNSPIISHPFLTSRIFMHSYSRSFSRSIHSASFARAMSNYSSGGRGGGLGGGGH